jgi:hypothetical protein
VPVALVVPLVPAAVLVGPAVVLPVAFPRLGIVPVAPVLLAVMVPAVMVPAVMVPAVMVPAVMVPVD